ncbi:hypothetical protein BC830DRAFT_1093836 [Chytriomyces sp. MP71]|nr:hypothetical protein BC830DRAFT_1093836 [Chytriomyces sp. MP71]
MPASPARKSKDKSKNSNPATKDSDSSPPSAVSSGKSGSGSVPPTASATPITAQKIYSSLPLQILLYLNERYFPVMWIILLAMLIYKGKWFPYMGTALPLEIFGLFPFAVLEAARLFLGNRGNKMEERASFALFLGLTILTIFAHLFYCIWQTYVTIIDLVVCGVGLFLVFIQLFSGIAQIISFHRIV